MARRSSRGFKSTKARHLAKFKHAFGHVKRMLDGTGRRVSRRRLSKWHNAAGRWQRKAKRASNPFNATKPAEWATMSKSLRKAWNRRHWRPEQWKCDLALKKEATRLKHRGEKVGPRLDLLAQKLSNPGRSIWNTSRVWDQWSNPPRSSRKTAIVRCPSCHRMHATHQDILTLDMGGRPNKHHCYRAETGGDPRCTSSHSNPSRRSRRSRR